MRAAEVELKTEGVVRVMHPDKGMGVEFTQTTPSTGDCVEKFLSVLTENRDLLPELLVEPEACETGTLQNSRIAAESGVEEDALLALFRQAALPADLFLAELRKQRGLTTTAAAASS